jgi:hypothetical protein
MSDQKSAERKSGSASLPSSFTGGSGGNPQNERKTEKESVPVDAAEGMQESASKNRRKRKNPTKLINRRTKIKSKKMNFVLDAKNKVLLYPVNKSKSIKINMA